MYRPGRSLVLHLLYRVEDPALGRGPVEIAAL